MLANNQLMKILRKKKYLNESQDQLLQRVVFMMKKKVLNEKK